MLVQDVIDRLALEVFQGQHPRLDVGAVVPGSLQADADHEYSDDWGSSLVLVYSLQVQRGSRQYAYSGCHDYGDLYSFLEAYTAAL